jgi:hypothetical protein
MSELATVPRDRLLESLRADQVDAGTAASAGSSKPTWRPPPNCAATTMLSST